MKKMFLLSLFLIFSAAPSFAQYVFSDGTNALSEVRSLPSQGVSRPTGNLIVNLYAASPALRAECGWYEFSKTNIDYASGYVCVSSLWRFSPPRAILMRFYAPAPFRSFEISKYRLCLLAQEKGKLDALISFVNADPRTKFLWDAAQTLDRTNAFILSAEAKASEAFGISRAAVSNLLYEARVK